MALTYQCIKERFNRDEVVVRCAHVHLTTSAAVSAGCPGPCCGNTTFENGLILERARRAGIDACATTYTRALRQGGAGIGNNSSFVSPVEYLPDKLSLNLIANPHTAVAENAMRHVNVDIWVRIVVQFLAVNAEVFLSQTVLQGELMKGFFGKATKGVSRMILGQHAQQHPAFMLERTRMC